MNVLLFKTYFAWKDLHVLTTGLSDFTSVICSLKNHAQLVKELQCRHSAGRQRDLLPRSKTVVELEGEGCEEHEVTDVPSGGHSSF